MRLVAAVLAGGAARRFGSDKLRLPLAEVARAGMARRDERPHETALGRVMGACLEAGLETLVVGGAWAEQRPPLEQVRWLADVPGVGGPLGGLLAVMGAVPDAEVLLLAGDTPRLTAAAVRWLVGAHEAGNLTGVARGTDGGNSWEAGDGDVERGAGEPDGADAAGAETPGGAREHRDPGRGAGLEPLATVYPAAAREPLEAFAAAGGRSLRQFLEGRPELAKRAVDGGVARAFRDFDTPEALQALGLRVVGIKP
jgi:molybdopterin-guanine dinucleotide biosynthesis protein A